MARSDATGRVRDALATLPDVSNRPAGGDHEYTSTGDSALAAAVVDALPALAFL